MGAEQSTSTPLSSSFNGCSTQWYYSLMPDSSKSGTGMGMIPAILANRGWDPGPGPIIMSHPRPVPPMIGRGEARASGDRDGDGDRGVRALCAQAASGPIHTMPGWVRHCPGRGGPKYPGPGRPRAVTRLLSSGTGTLELPVICTVAPCTHHDSRPRLARKTEGLCPSCPGGVNLHGRRSGRLEA